MTMPVSLRVHQVTWETERVRRIELRPTDGGDLPAFTAGAHIDLHLGNGMVRSYSLLNDQAERHRYVLGVALDPASRGGSRFVHEHLAVGGMLRVSEPRNNFPLTEAAAHTRLLAGGIGITPLLGMIRRLEALGMSWDLHYCARSRTAAAFLDQLEIFGARVRLRFDEECAGPPDLPALVDGAPAGTHFYCCGPLPMLAAFEAATAGLPAAQRHAEYFTAREQAATDGGYTVELARSGQVLAVAAGTTILDTLQAAGIEVPSSCLQGVCGTCETRVLAGIPDHRDSVLSDAERASNKTMLICCSGAKTPKLVLDL